jgi:hypothetical protein
MESMPGTSLMVNRLAKYVQECDPESVVLHLVDHGAGLIFYHFDLGGNADFGTP